MISVTTVTVIVGEDKDETITLIFKSQNVAKDVKSQLVEQGYKNTKAQVIKELS